MPPRQALICGSRDIPLKRQRQSSGEATEVFPRTFEMGSIMTVDSSIPVRVHEARQLRHGEEIEARHRSIVVHRGVVQDLLPSLDVFWILDTRTSLRKLIDFSEYSVWLIPSPAGPRTPDTARLTDP